MTYIIYKLYKLSEDHLSPIPIPIPIFSLHCDRFQPVAVLLQHFLWINSSIYYVCHQRFCFSLSHFCVCVRESYWIYQRAWTEHGQWAFSLSLSHWYVWFSIFRFIITAAMTNEYDWWSSISMSSCQLYALLQCKICTRKSVIALNSICDCIDCSVSCWFIVQIFFQWNGITSKEENFSVHVKVHNQLVMQKLKYYYINLFSSHKFKIQKEFQWKNKISRMKRFPCLYTFCQ